MSVFRQVRGNSAAHHFLRVTAFFVLLFAAPIQAGGFQLTPTLAEVPAERRSATFTLKNPGEDAVTIQVTGYSWSQDGGQRILADANHLVIVPPIVTIPPGGEQVVRVADLDRNPREESAYRVQFLEIPVANKQGAVGLQTALKLDVPLFFLAEEPSGRIEWQLKKTAGRNLELSIVNHGNMYARFSKLALENSHGKSLGTVTGPLYLLPGAKRILEISSRAAPVARGDELTIKVIPSMDQEGVTLVVE